MDHQEDNKTYSSGKWLEGPSGVYANFGPCAANASRNKMSILGCKKIYGDPDKSQGGSWNRIELMRNGQECHLCCMKQQQL